ncbi:lysophospholipid acyltransferase family protein [Spirochaetota bacterium]
MNSNIRPEIPKEKIIQVKNIKRIDFNKPFKFIYFHWWFELLTIIPYLITYFFVILCAIFFGFSVVGRKNLGILKKQGCITISNHCHYFDTVFAHLVIFPKYLHVSVAQRNFEVPYIRRILRILRCFPIPGEGKGLKLISPPVGEALKRKRHIHFLPEGDLVHLSQTIHRFHKGAFYLSCRHQAPIVPMVYILKRRKILGKLMRPNWIKITLVVGKPIIPPEQSEGNIILKEDIQELSNKAASWMERTIKENQQYII